MCGPGEEKSGGGGLLSGRERGRERRKRNPQLPHGYSIVKAGIGHEQSNSAEEKKRFWQVADEVGRPVKGNGVKAWDLHLIVQ